MPMSVEEFMGIISNMDNGQRFVYYTGYIAFDRANCDKVASLSDAAIEVGTAFGIPIYKTEQGHHEAKLNGKGFGFLTQKKIGNGRYEYYFTRKNLNIER